LFIASRRGKGHNVGAAGAAASEEHSVKPLALALAFLSLAAQTDGNWTTLFDGTHFDNLERLGTANWTIVDGSAEASSGTGFLVTKETYADFELRVEFWVDEAGNSGVFMRCQDRTKIGDKTCYEANIFDKRPDPTFRTGAITHLAPPMATVNASGHWNTYEISMNGPHIIVTLNGTKTVDFEDTKFSSGPIALQYFAGHVKIRKVQIRRL
jgi:hypothetical protein